MCMSKEDMNYLLNIGCLEDVKSGSVVLQEVRFTGLL